MRRIPLDGTLLEERAENVARVLIDEAGRGGSVELDLRGLEIASPGAAVQLGNALRPAAHSGCRLTVRLPDLETATFLDGQLLALQIASHSASIREGRRADGKRAVQHRLEEVAQRRPSNELIQHEVRSSAVAATRTVRAFENLLTDWSVTFPSDALGPIRDRVVPLAGAIAEACWNVLDHSYKAPLEPGSTVMSSFGCRWLPRSQVVFAPEGFDGSASRASEYLAALSDTPGSGQQLMGFVEVTVVDDGVGIAARQALSETVYRADVQTELLHFSDALASGGSVKVRSGDCAVDRTPGFGFTNVAAALWRAYGFASVRSGRAVAHYLGHHETASDYRFEVEASDRASLTGTFVHMLVPLYRHGDRFRMRQIDEPRLF